MRKLSLAIVIIGMHYGGWAQIQITSSDMPSSGDDYIMTSAFNDGSIDPELTGANYTWDFSSLTPVSSATDTFGNIFYLPLVYQLFFFGSNLVEFYGQDLNLGVTTIEDVYAVYDAGSSTYELSGYAGTLSGVPVPMVYGSKDVIYNFPLQYGNVDSADALLVADVPTVIYIEQQRHRVNEVDGWGTLITPIGTYDVLRVKSSIYDIDSIYLASATFGITVPINSFEYKWLAEDEGIPVMQILAQNAFGFPVITSITYRDSAVFSSNETVSDQLLMAAYPNPASEMVNLNFGANETGDVRFYNSLGELALEELDFTSGEQVDLADLNAGLYFIHIGTASGNRTGLLLVEH